MLSNMIDLHHRLAGLQQMLYSSPLANHHLVFPDSLRAVRRGNGEAAQLGVARQSPYYHRQPQKCPVSGQATVEKRL